MAAIQIPTSKKPEEMVAGIIFSRGLMSGEDMDKVMHFEIPADDVDRARKFYKTVFGWKTNPVPDMEYTMIHTVEVDKNQMPKERGAINGGMMKRGLIKGPVITISVKDIDGAIKKVKKEGGDLVLEKQVVGDMGLAYVRDSEGNVIGLWQPTDEG